MELNGTHWYHGAKAPDHQYTQCFVFIVQLTIHTKYHIFHKQHDKLKIYFEKNTPLFKDEGAVVILL